MEMRTLADWVIRQRLLTIPGVSQVIAIGGGVKQYQVLVNPPRLASLGLTLESVERAVGASNKNSTGGYLDAQSQEFLIRNIGRLQDPAELASTVVATR